MSGKKNLIQNIFASYITQMCYIIDQFLLDCGEKQYNTFLDFLPEELIDLIYRFVHKARMQDMIIVYRYQPGFSPSLRNARTSLHPTEATLHMKYHEIKQLRRLNTMPKKWLDEQVVSARKRGEWLRWMCGRSLPHNLAKRTALYGSQSREGCEFNGDLHHRTVPLVSSYKGGEFDATIAPPHAGSTPLQHHHWQLKQLQCGVGLPDDPPYWHPLLLHHPHHPAHRF